MFQPGRPLDDYEKEIILTALRFYQGNKVQTAESLGISVRTLYNKLETYGIETGKEEKANGVETSARMDVQPTFKNTEKQPMPMSERQEIQKVLP